jgi:hypothetical protein
VVQPIRLSDISCESPERDRNIFDRSGNLRFADTTNCLVANNGEGGVTFANGMVDTLDQIMRAAGYLLVAVRKKTEVRNTYFFRTSFLF